MWRRKVWPATETGRHVSVLCHISSIPVDLDDDEANIVLRPEI